MASLLINGNLTPGDLEMQVLNPATEEVLASCPRASKRQLDEAVAAAKAAFPAWAATPIEHRRAAVVKMADIIEVNVGELARLLTSEQGKPLPDATREVMGMAAFFRYFGSLDLPMKVIESSGKRRVEAHRRPLGVVGAIIPWNYPLVILSFKLPLALLAGNTLVVKPAPTTPLSTLRFAELVKDVLPPGVLNVIADANDLGDAMTHHPDIRKISFTGTTATGKKVMASAAETLKRITLELGGNDAGIVLDDVDPKKIAPGVFEGAFQNSGQVCIAIKRLYVHESVYDEMCNELVALANGGSDHTFPAVRFEDPSRKGAARPPTPARPHKGGGGAAASSDPEPIIRKRYQSLGNLGRSGLPPRSPSSRNRRSNYKQQSAPDMSRGRCLSALPVQRPPQGIDTEQRRRPKTSNERSLAQGVWASHAFKSSLVTPSKPMT